MARDAKGKQMSRRPDQDPPPDSGWRAFLLGMVGMFAAIGAWLFLVGTGSDQHRGDARAIDRSRAAPGAGPAPEPDRSISDYR